MPQLEPVPLAEVLAARNRIAGKAIRTPLVRLNVDTAADIYLKLENLQPIGSFKIRGAGNAMLKQKEATMTKGVYTASAGNMAQGVAWNAKRLGIPCHVVVPDHAPKTKLEAIERMGARVIKVSFDEWWRVIVTHHFPGLD
ncbi:MAG: pyridoxal-phosphate dependent enzyme, partial [Gemmatimonadales bacterium]